MYSLLELTDVNVLAYFTFFLNKTLQRSSHFTPPSLDLFSSYPPPHPALTPPLEAIWPLSRPCFYAFTTHTCIYCWYIAWFLCSKKYVKFYL